MNLAVNIYDGSAALPEFSYDPNSGAPYDLNSAVNKEAALEFMFFDLASCVIDDAEPVLSADVSTLPAPAATR